MKVIHVNQVNENIEIQFRIMNGAQPFNVPEGVSCTIRGTKGDNFGYAADVAVTAGSNIVTVTLTEQLTAVAGAGNIFELVFVGASDDMKVSTENFLLDVERAALGEDTVVSDSDLAYADQVLNQLQSVGAVNAQVQQNKANIAAEITRATAAEQTLQQNINAEAAARQAADNTLQSNINAEASSRATTDASLQSQINQLVAPSGEAPSAAEVQNARIGTDGTVYPTLGDAIRTQNSLLKSHLIDLGANGDLDVPVAFNWQNGYVADSGVLGASTASQYALVTLTAGQTIIVGTRNTHTAVIASTTSDSVSIGDTLTVIYNTGGTDVYTEFSYTAKENINIVVSVRKSEFNVCVKEPSIIKNVSERVDNLEEGVLPIEKTLTWSNGWIGITGKINQSTASQFALVQLNRGETVKVGTANSSTCIIGCDTRSSVSVDDKISIIITTGSGDTGYLEHTFTAPYTMNVVICVFKKNYDVKFYKQSDLGICEEKITDLLNITDKNYYEEIVSENGSFGASGLTYGVSNRIRTALIAFSPCTRIFIKNGSLQHACGMWQDVVDSSHIKRNDNSFSTEDESFVTAYSGYLVVVFRDSSNTSLSPNDYDGTIKIYKPSFSNLEDVLNRLNNARHIPRNAGVPLTFLHISDIHNSPITLNQIVNQTEYYDNKIDEMICTGDLVADTYTNITSWWNEKVLTCIGNHDTAGYVDGNFSWTALSMANRDAYYIAPFESNWNIIHTGGTSYYYKDYAESNVRLIVMDAMLYNDNGPEATAQTNWLTNLLADAITNELHVLIAIHSPHGGAKPVNCSFTELGVTDMPTLSDCNTPQSVIDTVATAINNGLHFIGYICGHTHRDTIWDAEDDGRQLMFAIICAMNSPANTDLYRGPNNNAYNLVTIDTVNTLVKIVRGGGADIDNAMRTRKAICFNYSTGEKVGEVL